MKTLPKIAFGVLCSSLVIVSLVVLGFVLVTRTIERKDATVYDANGNKIVADIPGDPRMPVEWVSTDWFGADETMRTTVFETITPARKPCPSEMEEMLKTVRAGQCSVVVYNPTIKSFRFAGFLARRDPSEWYGEGYATKDVVLHILALHGQNYFFQGSSSAPQAPDAKQQETPADQGGPSSAVDPTNVNMTIKDLLAAQASDLDSKQLEDYSNEPARDSELFGALEDNYMPQAKPAKWKKYKDIETLRDYFASHASEDNFFDQAYVIRKDGRIVVVKATYQIGDGDWVLNVQYYFDASNKLEKIVSDLSTFHGNVSIIRDIYFSSEGDMIGNVVHYYPLGKFKKELTKPSPDLIEEPIPVYKSTDDLPFK